MLARPTCAGSTGRRATFSVLLLWLLSPLGYFIIGYGRSGFRGKLAEAATTL
ncbi:hypothetical protein [Frigoribacterium sp. UYMn621]|uniref:hypothetical protein n=1 Tax=Frigoribacterium sp. UYMn621 TaxID=3156343 RepID=UPI003395441F